MPEPHVGQQEGHAGHVLHAADQHDLGVAEQDLLRTQLRRFHAGPAGDVDVVGADFLGDSCADAHLAAGVRTVAGLARVSQDGLVDLVGVDVRPAHRLDRRPCAQLHRGRLGERAQELPDGGAGALDDHRTFHAASLPAGPGRPDRESSRSDRRCCARMRAIAAPPSMGSCGAISAVMTAPGCRASQERTAASSVGALARAGERDRSFRRAVWSRAPHPRSGRATRRRPTPQVAPPPRSRHPDGRDGAPRPAPATDRGPGPPARTALGPPGRPSGVRALRGARPARRSGRRRARGRAPRSARGWSCRRRVRGNGPCRPGRTARSACGHPWRWCIGGSG